MPSSDKRVPQVLAAPSTSAAPSTCPVCSARVAPGGYETHLRQAHRLYLFRDARRTYTETLALLLNLLAADPPDAEAWRELLALMREEHGARAPAVLAALLGALLTRMDDDGRTAAVERLADLLAPSPLPLPPASGGRGRGEGADAPLTAALAADGETPARRLALAVIARQTPPFDPALLQPLRGLMLDRRLPVEAQAAALAALTRSAGMDSPLAVEFLYKFVAGLGKAQAVERLREFERLHGKAQRIDALCAELEEQMRMSCPRCSVELRRPAMIRHLWDEHRLILDGRRVRDPWAVVEDWIIEHRATGDAELLERIRLRGAQLDPENGLHRVHRMLLRTGSADAEARRDLFADAQQRHASLCPWCYALAPLPREAPPLPINVRPGRLTAGDYAVETTPMGIWNRLEVRIGNGVIRRGPEGRMFLTRRGALLFFAGPWVLAALAAVVWPGTDTLGVAALLSATALAAVCIIRFLWRKDGAPPRRLVRHAWTLLAPHLHLSGFSSADSAFLAGLAQVTPPGAFRQQRAPLLTGLLKRTEDAVAGGQGPPNHLASLRRLMVEDAAAFGADPVPLVADTLSRCFEGRLPLVYAEQLLTDWRSPWWTKGNRVRIRVLLCDRAFEAGFEVSNLVDAGQTAPALGEVLGIDDPAGLAALRLLWSQRPTRPWDHCGAARTVFDLAAEPSKADLLGRRPDLLLWQREPQWVVAAEGGAEPMREAEIALCAGGLWLQEICFTAAPAAVEESYRAFGGSLTLGKHRFRGAGEIDALARRMERWFRFAFTDFLPRTKEVQTWRSPERTAVLRAWGAAPCPECGRYLLPRAGAIGVALDEAAPSGERGVPGR
ncbi:MAG TPA: hypothetical protein VMS17_25580 [Gemmataceae bacterium]|nr:hypothetical protein [Gemmataceae bacterium]